jgi:hypothetical protein
MLCLIITIHKLRLQSNETNLGTVHSAPDSAPLCPILTSYEPISYDPLAQEN